MRTALINLIGGFQVSNTVTTTSLDLNNNPITEVVSTGLDLEYIVIGGILLLTFRFIYESLLVFMRAMISKGGK